MATNPRRREHSATTTKFNLSKALKVHHSKSGVIRSLAAEGKSVNEITHILQEAGLTNDEGTTPIRYQHVRNVLKMPVGKQSTQE